MVGVVGRSVEVADLDLRRPGQRQRKLLKQANQAQVGRQNMTAIDKSSELDEAGWRTEWSSLTVDPLEGGSNHRSNHFQQIPEGA